MRPFSSAMLTVLVLVPPHPHPPLILFVLPAPPLTFTPTYPKIKPNPFRGMVDGVCMRTWLLLMNSDLVQPVWCTYGYGARPATAISPDGGILFQQEWLHTGRLAHELDVFFNGDDALDNKLEKDKDRP